MYSYTWDSETGGLLLNSSPLQFSKEPRPVYYKELDILGFDKYWKYEKDDSFPYMWAEANNYFYRGRLVAKTKGGSLYTAPELILIEDPEPNGAPLRFVDISTMVEKNREIMEKLVNETTKEIYNVYAKYKSKIDVFYVAFSGGKDSVVTLDLVQNALPHNEFKVLFGDTGMEFPDTYEIVEKTKYICKEFNIEFHVAKSEFDPEYTWHQFGPPSQTMRWCCSVHKTTPQILYLRKYIGNPHFQGMAFTGVRREESSSRSEYEKVTHDEKVKGQYSYHAILEWNSAELFNYIYSRNLLINEAYKKGNSRAGCLVCPLAAPKNTFFKEQCYSKNSSKFHTTTFFNDIILETSSKELSNKSAVKEFMDIGGWKARRSGKELSFADNFMSDSFENGTLKVVLNKKRTDWHQWIKTVGEVTFLRNDTIEILYDGKTYRLIVFDNKNELTVIANIESQEKRDIVFLSMLKTVFRKSAYCIGCRVCEANCPYGFISINSGNVIIDDKCKKCHKCHEVQYGCLVANSMRLPKGEKKMGSIDRYGSMGVEFSWIDEYFKKKDAFWTSAHSLGTNKVKILKCFLNDSEITTKGRFTAFGARIDSIGLDSEVSWSLILCNLAYTSEFNWWIMNIDFNTTYTPSSIYAMLDDAMSENSRSHIIRAYKNILISIPQLGANIGLGICDFELKNGKRFLHNVIRTPWSKPDPRVIMYSL